MANIEFQFPVLGLNKGEAFDKQPKMTSDYLNNVRPYDVLENRRRGGQRPGLEKMFSEQVSGMAVPVVAIEQIAVLS